MLTYEPDELRTKLKTFEGLGYKASAREVRRKIRAIERGIDPDAPKIDTRDRRPRKRVTWSRPSRRAGYFFVRLTCGHRLDVKGVPAKQSALSRAPYTAVCMTCDP